jgi:Flp pilus assembly protein TadG
MKRLFSRRIPRNGASSDSPRRRSRGQVMVIGALAIVVLLVCAGLAVDVGLLWTQYHQMKNATDAAAKAAAEEILSGNAQTVSTGSCTKNAPQCAGINDASINGFTAGGANNVSVTINTPPLSGPNAGDSQYAEAIISQSVPTYFLRVLSLLGVTSASSVPMTTRATAKIQTGNACIWTEDPTTAQRHSLTIGENNNDADLYGPNCTVFINSGSVDPLSTHNGGCTYMKSITIVGSYINDSDCVQAAPYPQPVTGAPPVTDPLAYMQEPTVGGCDFGTSTTAKVITASAVLSPGTYCGGIQIYGGSSVVVTFSAGTYILNGGGLIAENSSTVTAPGPGGTPPEGGAAGQCGADTCDTTPTCSSTVGPTLLGTGVTFYNTGSMSTSSSSTASSTASSGASSGSSTSSGGTTTTPSLSFAGFNIQAASGSSLTAPTSGANEGMLFMEDRTSPTSTGNLIACGSYTGTFYFPNAELSFGGTGSPAYNNFLAYDLLIGTTYTVGTNYTSLQDGSPFKIGTALSE